MPIISTPPRKPNPFIQKLLSPSEYAGSRLGYRLHNDMNLDYDK